MKTQSYLTFNLHSVTYGIDASLVKEIFLLPELTPIAESPKDIVGILNLRGKIVPVMHLDLRLGNPMQECKVSDSVIVLDWENLLIGVIVNAVREVIPIASKTIQKEIDYGRVRTNNPAFISGIAQIDEDAIVLLNPDALIRQPDAVKSLVGDDDFDNNADDYSREDSKTTLVIVNSFYDLCCPNATRSEIAVFKRRAENLRKATNESISDLTGQLRLAVVGLAGEYFGIDLDTVREFINVRNFTRIPCCPSHIIGNMNLRGEIVTLVDIRGTLNLSTSTTNIDSKAVVINVNDIVAGLSVDEVFDVMYLHPEEIMPVPIAIESGEREYLRGTALYSEKTIAVLDLPKLLTKGGLVIDEEL